MKTIVIDDRGVCLSVCPSRGSTRLLCAKTAERIKILFGLNTPGGQRNIVLEWGPDPPQRGKGYSMQPLQSYFGLLLLICRGSLLSVCYYVGWYLVGHSGCKLTEGWKDTMTFTAQWNSVLNLWCSLAKLRELQTAFHGRVAVRPTVYRPYTYRPIQKLTKVSLSLKSGQSEIRL